MLRFCYVGIAFLAVFSLNLAEEYEGDDDAKVAHTSADDTSVHLIPDSKPLQFIDSSTAAVGHYSIADFLKPSPPLISSIESSPVDESIPKTLTNSSCLTLVLADNLKEHITPDNLQPVTVLLQHSLETCPGLKSTFEILQKMMDIKGMSIEEAINFIQKLTISSEDEEASEVHIEEEHKNVVENEEISVQDHETVEKIVAVDNSETDVSIPDSIDEEATPEQIENSETNIHESETEDKDPEPIEDSEIHESEKEEDEGHVEPSEETNIETSEEEADEEEDDDTNPMDVIQSVLSAFEQNPEHLSTSLTDETDDENEESIEEFHHENHNL